MGETVGGRIKREGTYVYLWLIHVDVWQKPTQYWTSVILQLKINKPKIKLLLREKQFLVNPGKIWHRGCFDLDRHHCFFMFILRLKIEVGGFIELLSLSVVVWVSSLTQPFLLLTLWLILFSELRVKIMARLKHLSLEAIHKIPLKTDSADRAHLVLCCWFWYLVIEPAQSCDQCKTKRDAGSGMIPREGPWLQPRCTDLIPEKLLGKVGVRKQAWRG